jgi:hypothetical protein
MIDVYLTLDPNTQDGFLEANSFLNFENRLDLWSVGSVCLWKLVRNFVVTQPRLPEI